MVDSVTLLMIGDAVTGRVPRFPESVTQIIFEAVEFSLPFELKSMPVNLPCDPTSIIAGMKPGFFFEANAFLAGCGFETQSRTNFNPDMGITGLTASHAADADSAGPRTVSTNSSRQTGRQRGEPAHLTSRQPQLAARQPPPTARTPAEQRTPPARPPACTHA